MVFPRTSTSLVHFTVCQLAAETSSLCMVLRCCSCLNAPVQATPSLASVFGHSENIKEMFVLFCSYFCWEKCISDGGLNRGCLAFPWLCLGENMLSSLIHPCTLLLKQSNIFIDVYKTVIIQSISSQRKEYSFPKSALGAWNKTQ